MRKYIVLILVVSVIANIFLLGCSDENLNEHKETITNTDSEEKINIEDQYFDEERVYKPSLSDIKSITRGMPISEVVEIIGKPHDFGPTSGLFSLSWETSTSEMFFIAFALDSDAPAERSSIVRLLKYGRVIYVAPGDELSCDN